MKHFFALLLLAVTIAVGAQKPVKIKNSDLVKTSNRQIDFIKENGIMVRLKTNDLGLAAIRKAGNNRLADTLEARQKRQNDRILSAFKEQFDFAPVYYFYSRDMQKIRKGDFSTLYTLDNQPANYKSKDFFVVDPYIAVTSNSNSHSTGFTLMDSTNQVLLYPMPRPIIKRFGFIYKTYPQLVFDWNYRFRESANLSTESKLGELKMVSNKKSFDKAEEREIARIQRNIQRRFKKSYNWAARPRFGNSDK